MLKTRLKKKWNKIIPALNIGTDASLKVNMPFDQKPLAFIFLCSVHRENKGWSKQTSRSLDHRCQSILCTRPKHLDSSCMSVQRAQTKHFHYLQNSSLGWHGISTQVRFPSRCQHCVNMAIILHMEYVHKYVVLPIVWWLPVRTGERRNISWCHANFHPNAVIKGILLLVLQSNR